MSATNDTPLKRFTAFWFVLGAFLLFGIIALILAPLAKTPEVTVADEAGAIRRLAIRDEVEQQQAVNLIRTEKGDKLQVPPAEVFSLVGAKLAATKPQAVKDEKFRAPTAAPAEAAQTEAAEAEESKEAAPVEKVAEAPVKTASEEKSGAEKPVAPPAAPVAPAQPASPAPAASPAQPEAASSAVAPAAAAPAAKPSPALTPRAPRPETTSEPAESSSL